MSRLPVLAILITCRNRRETTLRALQRVRAQAPVFATRLFVFDDDSSDGTPEAVTDADPEAILIRGDGNAFWNGGLYQVWSEASKHRSDAFLWLNDDVELDEDAFARLADAWETMQASAPNGRFILVGATRDSNGKVTYRGMRAHHSPFAFHLDDVDPGDSLQPIDTFNGNIVLVTRAVVDRIGLNDQAFHHNWGDIDYGLPRQGAGIPVMLMPGTLGVCAANDAKIRRGYGSPHLSIREQWRKVNTHHGVPFASWWRLTRRHSGKWWPLHFLIPYRWLVLPRWPRGGAS